VVVGVLDAYTIAYPDKMKTKVQIELKSGETLICEKEDYYGFFTRPFSWEDTIRKFKRLATGVIDEDLQEQNITIVKDLEYQTDMSALTRLLSEISVVNTI
jgi:2-methylcitrate dehydratase